MKPYQINIPQSTLDDLRVRRANTRWPDEVQDIVPAPRSLAERFYDIRHWTEMPKGGHFAALEEPELLAGSCGFSFGRCVGKTNRKQERRILFYA